MTSIQNIATETKIPYLLHFTRAVNLPSIMAHGLYPIERINEIGADPVINDQLRLDGHCSSTSISIGFPNCQMLYKYRMADASVDWVILVLHSSILWAKNCAFCRHNAADGRISSQLLPSLMTHQSFAAMFEEIDGITSREASSLDGIEDSKANTLTL